MRKPKVKNSLRSAAENYKMADVFLRDHGRNVTAAPIVFINRLILLGILIGLVEYDAPGDTLSWLADDLNTGKEEA